jgi:uncharacterized protein (TIGR02118 family)
MLKNFSLMKRKDGMAFEEFRRWALMEHDTLGEKIPGMRHYRMNVALEENANGPDAISEMWFDDTDARNKAFATDEGKAAGADAAAHCSSRQHVLVEEKIVIE